LKSSKASGGRPSPTSRRSPDLPSAWASDRHQQQHPGTLQVRAGGRRQFIDSVMRTNLDKAMVVSFDTSAELVSDLVSDTDKLTAAIRDLRPAVEPRL